MVSGRVRKESTIMERQVKMQEYDRSQELHQIDELTFWFLFASVLILLFLFKCNLIEEQISFLDKIYRI